MGHKYIVMATSCSTGRSAFWGNDNGTLGWVSLQDRSLPGTVAALPLDSDEAIKVRDDAKRHQINHDQHIQIVRIA